tara:strand:- start:16516 stop:16926 length:411 start_codon:yes stop_codon:yes gene_type:complete
MGGSDDPDNLVTLSVKEHAIAHARLYLKYGNEKDYLAYKGLRKQIGKEQIFIETSRIGGLNNKGKLKTKEHRAKISESNKGQSSHWQKGDIQKKKENSSKAMKNNTNSKNHSSPEYKKKQSEAMKIAWKNRKERQK